MTVTGTMRGIPVRYDEDSRTWVWTDTGTPAEHFGEDYRPCIQCGMTPEPCERGCQRRHDPCLGHIDGALSCCCGHGLFVGHVNWPGLAVRDGWFAAVHLDTKE